MMETTSEVRYKPCDTCRHANTKTGYCFAHSEWVYEDQPGCEDWATDKENRMSGIESIALAMVAEQYVKAAEEYRKARRDQPRNLSLHKGLLAAAGTRYEAMKTVIMGEPDADAELHGEQE